MNKIILFIVILCISLLHYGTPVMPDMDLHAIYQRLYYIPIILCAYRSGLRWGLAAAFVSAITYLPHILLQWRSMPMEMFTQYVEILMFFIIGGLVGILSDRQKAQQQQIEANSRKMFQMEQMSLLGQLAAGLAHEIRNPLGSLIGSDEIIAEGLGATHPLMEFVTIMQKEHRRLRDKLNEFLQFARPRPICVLPNKLTELVHETVTQIGRQYPEIEYKESIQWPEIEEEILVDADKLKQILLNLLLNACQAMPAGGKIHVTTFRTKTGASISIEDQGPGISADTLDRIFEPFFTTKENGTGLGLAIVKQLAEEINGTVGVESSESGTTFILRITDEHS